LDAVAGEGQPLGAQDEVAKGVHAPRTDGGGTPQPADDEGVAVRLQDVTVVASGKWGQCPWVITADGVLTVRPGEGANPGTGASISSLWADCADEFTSVVFRAEGDDKVVAPSDCSQTPTTSRASTRRGSTPRG
jgi:hypothetical protein